MIFRCGPTGKLIQGNVLDVAIKPFERALKNYDSQLYVKWNPKKLKGWGCWEIRRLPNTKEVCEVFEWEGNTYSRIDYREIDIVNHVLDCAYLNYDQVRKIKSMDVWAKCNINDMSQAHKFGDMLELKEKEHEIKVKKAARDEMLYQAKQHKAQIQGFRELLLSGLNPAEIATVWDKSGPKRR